MRTAAVGALIKRCQRCFRDPDCYQRINAEFERDGDVIKVDVTGPSSSTPQSRAPASCLLVPAPLRALVDFIKGSAHKA
jgi:hypothetical protein